MEENTGKLISRNIFPGKNVTEYPETTSITPNTYRRKRNDNRMKKTFFLIFSILIIPNLSAQDKPFANDICLPSKQYMLTGVQNDLFIQTFLKRWRPYNDFVRFGGTQEYARRYEKVASVKNPETGKVIKAELVNGDRFEVVKTLESTVVAGEAGAGKNEVVVQFLGDSFTKGNYFKSAILEKGYVPNVKCVGLRKVRDCENQFHEGRGGWTLENYFSNKVDNPVFFNPFIQPQENLRYWGSTEFWKTAIGVNNKTIESKGLEPVYSCGDYDCSRFDAGGFLAKPEKGDVMYDFQNKCFVTWSGKKWEKTDNDSLKWTFQYGKYLSMWNIQHPRFLIVMLGLNDFRSKPLPADFLEWNARLETLLKSYREAVPDGRLVVCTPCTSCGILDNKAGDFTIRQNAAMWEVRNNIILVFDNRESEGVFVVDASITIDNDNGYNAKKTELPYEGYPGENRLYIQEGNPHPYPNYPNLALPIAAFVQYFRDK